MEPDRPQMKICCMHIACWIPNGTDKHSEYVVLIAFLLQQWLYECALVSHYTYIACLVMFVYNVSSVTLKFLCFGLHNALQVESAHPFNNIPFIFFTFIHLVLQL